MKLMVASDIHGSAAYCRRLVAAFENETPDKLLLLGDILYHGPRNSLPEEYNPQAVAEMLNLIKNNILCVRGNCDSEVDQMMLEFPIMADYCYVLLDGKSIFATHGHCFGPETLPPLNAGDILLYGHTHVPAFFEKSDIICINPGSASIPKEDSHHGYMIFENGTAEWKDFNDRIVKSEKI